VSNQIEPLCGQIEVKLREIENGREGEVEVAIGFIEKLKILDFQRGEFYEKRLEEGLGSTRKWFIQLEQESLKGNKEELKRVQEKMESVRRIIEDCAGTVNIQAETLDRIDWEVDSTVSSSKKAFFEVETTKNTQKSCKTCFKFSLATALILSLLIFLIFLLS